MIFRLACFVSCHGYGHATRTIAVVEALHQRCPEVVVDLFTAVPEAIFAPSLKNYRYHFLRADVGLVQKDAFTADLAATLAELDQFLNFDPALVADLARQVKGCQAVLADISPLGIAVAKKAKIPSVLVENFTWDWLYSHYLLEYPEFSRHIDQLAELYGRVTWHIQAEPICRKGQAVIHCAPIARPLRGGAQTWRGQLLSGGQKLVVVSLPDWDVEAAPWPAMAAEANWHFAIVGQKETKKLAGNITLFGRDLYHPDIIAAADVVLCEPGASTLAECVQGGCRVLLVQSDSPEAPVVAAYVHRHLVGGECSLEDVQKGTWLAALPALLAQPRPQPAAANGGLAVASFLAGL
ncbi:MAG: hypothetical protein LBH14_01105 [Desulfobulbaceae bacterium]|nr:hypothetical protein [Desulfobulbaceae bacterium]